MICSAVMMVSCAKTQKKKPNVQRQYTEYEKKQKEFEQTKHTTRSIDEINDIDIEATLVSTNKDGKKYFVKSEGSTSLLDAGFKKIAENEKEQKLYFRLNITEDEYKNFRKEDNIKYERLIDKINLQYSIPKTVYAVEGRENLGLTEDLKDGTSYLKLNKEVIGIKKNIMPQDGKVYFYSLFAGNIKYSFIFKDTDIYNLKDSSTVYNDYSQFDKPYNLKFNLVKDNDDIILNSVDESFKEMKEITLPYYITKIGKGVFKNYAKLQSINLQNIKEIQEEAFSKTDLREVNLESVLTVRKLAFSECRNIRKANTPKLKEIGYGAFNICEKLESIDLEKAEEVSDYAFSNCRALEWIDISNATTIGDHAFSGAVSMKVARLNKASEIKNDAFSNCSSLEFINLSEVKKIRAFSFHGCRKLWAVDLENIVELGTQTFANCSSLVEVRNLNKLKEVPESAFYECTSLKEIDLSKVEVIGLGAFSNCQSLEEINLASAKRLEHDAFSKCKKIKTIDLPNIESVGDRVFSGCKSLENINLHNLKTIGRFMFGDCEKLQHIDLSNIEEIKPYAFAGCEALTNVDLKNVKKIGERIFSRCDGIYKLLINGSENGHNEIYKVEDGRRVYRIADDVKVIDLDD